MKIVFTILTAGVAIAMNTYIHAQPGTLDPTFNGTGTAVTSFGNAVDVAYGVARQADGKIVVAGSTGSTAIGDFIVARYNTDGSLDNSFNGTGRVTTAVGSGDDIAEAVAIQADGKIVVAGSSAGNFYDFAVVRYNANGTLDNAFGTNGKATFDWGSVEEAHALAIQPDGRIIIAGGYAPSSIGDLLVVRLNTDGTLDNTFNGTGSVLIDAGTLYDRVQAVALQSNGKIVVAGGALQPLAGNFAVARINTDGTPDSTFSSDGVTTTHVIGDEEAYAIAIQADGKIVAAGKGTAGGPNDILVVRYNTDGSLDNGFGTAGKVTTAIGSGEDAAHAVSVQADQKVLVGGISNNGVDDDFAVVRYNTNGMLDNSFDGDGKVQTTVGISTDRAYAMLVQPDGKVVLAGASDNGTNNDLALARYNTNGSLDNTFSADGSTTTDNGPDDLAFALGIHPNGDIAVAGTSAVEVAGNTVADIAIARFNADGSLDNSFSADGKVTFDVGPNDVGHALVAQVDDKILVAGMTTTGSTSTFTLVRCNAFGLLDNSFSSDGKVTTSIGTSSGAYAVALQPDNKIVAAGFSTTGSDSDFALVRYGSTGTPDNTFNATGIVTTDMGSATDAARSIAIQPDGKLVLVGTSNGDFALARYNSDGSLDNSFDGDGKVITSVGSSDEGYAVALQADNKIVIAGGSDGSFAVTRYNANGSLDPTFSADGHVTTPIGTTAVARSVAIDVTGRIIVVGESDGVVAVAVYNTDGSLYTGFSGDGLFTFSIGSNAAVHHAALQADRHIVLAGSTGSGLSHDFATARVIGLSTTIGLEDSPGPEIGIRVWPNPVDHATSLLYTLTTAEPVTIQLLDTRGQLVETLVDHSLRSAGSHQLALPVSGALSAGYYQVLISTPSTRLSVPIVKVYRP